MNYFLLFIGAIILLIAADLLSIFWKLGLTRSRKALRLVVSTKGYRSSTSSIDLGSDKTLLVVGDSTVLGPGAHEENTLPDRLSRKYGFNVINLARNGLKTRDITNMFDQVAGQKFDLVLVCAGNNDIWKLTNLTKLPHDARELLRRARMISDRVIMFRGGNIGNCPFFPAPISWLYTYRSRKIREIFQSAARKVGALYVEDWMERKDDLFLKDPHKFYCWDMLHLNSKGFDVWFDYLVDKLEHSPLSKGLV